MKINNHIIGVGHPVYVIAEISANHHQEFSQAKKIIQQAYKCGANAVKLQTYTPDTLTIDCRNELFMIRGTVWDGMNLYDLYKEAFTPWEWHYELKKVADDLGVDFFSTPFDASAVDFLESLNVPAYKIASFELIDTTLLKKIASTGKPVILSTGMASLAEIDEAILLLKENGSSEIALLKCTSAYPATVEEMNLQTIVNLGNTFNLPVGLSDHSLGTTAPIVAVTLGATIIEKHLILDRSQGGPDSAFSMEPEEFLTMVLAIRQAKESIGEVSYQLTAQEKASRMFRRSLFVVRDIRQGEPFTDANIRSIRPGHGLAPKFYEVVLGKNAAKDIARGTPLDWSLIN